MSSGFRRVRMRTGVTRIILIAAVTVALDSSPARADWLSGPIRVMRPDGTILRFDSPLVAEWWKDYRRARCVSCKGTTGQAVKRASRLRYEVEHALGTPLRAGPRYLILPDVLELSWPYAWEFYPSTQRTSAYVVQRGAIGVSGARRNPLRWDSWYRASDRMEEIILVAAKTGNDDGPVRSVGEEQSTSSLSPWVIVALGAPPLALVALVLLRRGKRRKRSLLTRADTGA